MFYICMVLFIVGTLLEAQLSTFLDSLLYDKKAAAETKYVKIATAKVRLYNATHRDGICACFQEKY